MSKKVSVILLEDVSGLGLAGDIVSATEGHARNFLFPHGRAALADQQTTAQAAEHKQRQDKKSQQELAELQAKAEMLEGTELTIAARVKEGEGEELYGSITAKNIIDKLMEQTDLKLKAGDIALDKPLTRLGSYDVTVGFSPDVEATIRVTIESDES